MVVAKGVHPVPFRTRQLSPSAPMVLGSWPGRVGRRQRSVFLCLPHESEVFINSRIVKTGVERQKKFFTRLNAMDRI